MAVVRALYCAFLSCLIVILFAVNCSIFNEQIGLNDDDDDDDGDDDDDVYQIAGHWQNNHRYSSQSHDERVVRPSSRYEARQSDEGRVKERLKNGTEERRHHTSPIDNNNNNNRSSYSSSSFSMVSIHLYLPFSSPLPPLGYI